MTKEELKAKIASKENKLAGEAIASIKNGEPLETLQALVEAGATELFYERDPAHPRSRFTVKSVLDTCFETDFGIISQKTETSESGYKSHSVTSGEVHNSQGRDPHFAYLLSRGFTPGENGYRGALFPHILNSCFYTRDGEARKQNAIRFAKILCDAGKYDVQLYAAHKYGWVGHIDDLQTILELGANPTGSEMIDCALTYVGCAPTGGHTTQDRIDVIKALLKLGATPKKDLYRAVSWQNIREHLTEAGLIDELSEFGVIEKKHPQEYLNYLERCGKPIPEIA